MSKENVDYVEFSVRAKYDSNSKQVSFTSQDESIKGKPFYMTLRSGTSTYDTMIDLFHRKGVVKQESDITLGTKLLKKMTLRAPSKPFAITKIKLGVDIMGNEVFIDTNFGRNLPSGVSIVGQPGSGKTILMDNFLNHAEITPNVKAVYLDCKADKELIAAYKNSDNVTLLSERATFFSELDALASLKNPEEILLVCMDYESLLGYGSDKISPRAEILVKDFFSTARSRNVYVVVSYQSEVNNSLSNFYNNRIDFEDNGIARIKDQSHLFRPYIVEDVRGSN